MIPAALLPFFVLAVQGELVGMYSQCGGENWTGATECSSPATCYSQNPYYYQCTTLTYIPESAEETTTAAQTATNTPAAVSNATSTSSSAPAETTATSSQFIIEITTTSSPVEAETTYTSPTAVETTVSSVDPVETNTSSPADVVTTTPSPASVETTSTSPVAVETTSQTTTSQTTTSLQATTLSTKTVSSVAAAASSDSSSNITAVSGGWSGTGETTRYWDCCKPSCAWDGKSTDITTPVQACDASGNVLTDANVESGCVGGTAYMCNDQTPWVISDTLAYGFAAASVIGGTEQTMCCSCVKLTFTDQLVGKEMVVQITNTGTDLTSNHFDIALPGGGVGYYTDGCSSEFGSGYSWGEQYGGVTSESECSGLPSALDAGCEFRFGSWWNGADNPGVTFEQVVCPAELIAKTGCGRTDQ